MTLYWNVKHHIPEQTSTAYCWYVTCWNVGYKLLEHCLNVDTYLDLPLLFWCLGSWGIRTKEGTASCTVWLALSDDITCEHSQRFVCSSSKIDCILEYCVYSSYLITITQKIKNGYGARFEVLTEFWWVFASSGMVCNVWSVMHQRGAGAAWLQSMHPQIKIVKAQNL